VSTRVKADIMILRHVGYDERLLIVRLTDPSTQVLPLIGPWAGRTDQGIAKIWVAGFIYSALTVALFFQAPFGEPLIRI
jgi:hypothetical protein